jgi:hypothetical protein
MGETNNKKQKTFSGMRNFPAMKNILNLPIALPNLIRIEFKDFEIFLDKHLRLL